MKQFGLKRIALLLFIIQLFFILGGTSVFAYEIGDASDTLLSHEYSDTQAGVSNKSADIKISSRFYELLFNKSKEKNQRLYLIPGGDVFGIRIKEKDVTVSSAKESSALKRGDKILSVCGTEIKEAADIGKALDGCNGGAVNIDIIRGGEKMTVTVIPKYEGGAYRLGITLKRAACGIGTVSFIDPESGAFGGLGHGVCDSESGKLIEINAGDATAAEVYELIGYIRKTVKEKFGVELEPEVRFLGEFNS